MPGKDDTLTVLDTGASVDRDPQGRPRVSYGALLENESPDLVLGRAQVRIRLRDAEGNLLTFRRDGESEPATKALHHAWMRLDERIGVGEYAYLELAPGKRLPKTVNVEATIEGDWFNWCAFSMQRIGIGDIETAREGNRPVIRFTADVPTSCSVSRLTDDFADVHAIYYDRGGDLVGGEALRFATHDLKGSVTGTAGMVTATAHIPAAADPQRTKVYAMGGCGGPPPSGTPR